MVPNSLLLFLAIALPSTLPIIAQTPATSANDAVRVTVTLNADGSRTIYQFDNAKHEGIATTTDPNGQPRGKIVYQIGRRTIRQRGCLRTGRKVPVQKRIQI